jgi:PAS domain S-box-containing protein
MDVATNAALMRPPAAADARAGKGSMSRLRRIVVGFAVFWVLLVLALVAVYGAYSRRDTEQQLAQAAEALARLAASQAQQSLLAADVALAQVSEELEAATPELMPSERGRRVLRRNKRLVDQIHRLTVFERGGPARYDTFSLLAQRAADLPPGIAPDGNHGLRISPPFEDGASGLTVFAIARDMRDMGAVPGGMVVAEIDPRHFADFQRVIDPMYPGVEVLLIAPNGIILARHPQPLTAIGTEVGRSIATWLITSIQADGRSFVAPGAIDGIARTYVTRRLTGYPITMLVGVDRAAALDQWQDQIESLLVMTVVLAGVITALITLIVIQLKRRERSEAALARSEAAAHKLALVAARTQNGVMITDAAGRIEWSNEGFTQLMGLSAEEACGRDPVALADPAGEASERVAAIREDLAAGRAIDIEFRRGEGDATRWLRMQIAPVRDASGAIANQVAVLSDVTDTHRLQEAAIAARDSAEAASRAKSEFLANMSHELRTPLNAVIGFSEIMKNEIFGPVGERYREYVQNIHASGNHLLSLINDVLDLSKVEAHKFKLSEDLVDLDALLDECLSSVRVAADKGHIALAHGGDPATPLVVCDERAVRQVMLNLLSNAIKFTPPGGTVSTRLGCTNDGDIEFAVADSGIGIAPNDLDRIMQPFEQVQSGFTRTRPGTGLGLALSRRFVELHGGSIAITSELGRGTTVTVRLPASRIDAAEEVAAHAAPHAAD